VIGLSQKLFIVYAVSLSGGAMLGFGVMLVMFGFKRMGAAALLFGAVFTAIALLFVFA